MGILALRAGLIVTLFSIPVIFLWRNGTAFILHNLLFIPIETATLAQDWARFLSLSLWPQIYIEITKKFLQAQRIIWPMTFSAVGGLTFNVVLNTILILKLKWGYRGAGFTVALTPWFTLALLWTVVAIRRCFVRSKNRNVRGTISINNISKAGRGSGNSNSNSKSKSKDNVSYSRVMGTDESSHSTPHTGLASRFSIEDSNDALGSSSHGLLSNIGEEEKEQVDGDVEMAVLSVRATDRPQSTSRQSPSLQHPNNIDKVVNERNDNQETNLRNVCEDGASYTPPAYTPPSLPPSPRATTDEGACTDVETSGTSTPPLSEANQDMPEERSKEDSLVPDIERGGVSCMQNDNKDMKKGSGVMSTTYEEDNKRNNRHNGEDDTLNRGGDIDGADIDGCVEGDADPEDNLPDLSISLLHSLFQDWHLILSMGIPGALSLFVEWGSFELAASLAGTLGTIPLAVHAIYMQVRITLTLIITLTLA